MRCLRCNRELEAGHKSVALYMFAQTVGIKPRQKSTAHRISFCPQCSVSLAMGPPPEGALNMAAWDMIRDLVGSDPALNQAAWENLSGILGLLPATGTDGAPRPLQPVGISSSDQKPNKATAAIALASSISISQLTLFPFPLSNHQRQQGTSHDPAAYH